ncbi:uncharacterized protein ISCGN_026824 [Ixodes scapularis]
MQSTEVKSSCHMELEGLTRSLVYFAELGITVEVLVTDRHLQVSAYMKREHPFIQHRFDIWHVSKGSPYSADAYYNGHLEGLLQHKLEKFKEIMLSGYRSLGIRVMDPLDVPDADMSPILGGDIFTFQLSQIQVRHLSTYVVTRLAALVKDSKVYLTFEVPRVTATMRYNVTGSLFEVFPLKGDGQCDLAYSNVTVSAVAHLKTSKGKFQFTNFEDASVDFETDQVLVPHVTPGSLTGLGSQVGRVIFWTLAKQVDRTLPDNLLRYLNDALERAPRPIAGQVHQ